MKYNANIKGFHIKNDRQIIYMPQNNCCVFPKIILMLLDFLQPIIKLKANYERERVD